MVKLNSCALGDLARYTEPALRGDSTVSTKPASRMHNGYLLTDEQNHAVNLAEQHQDLKIEAFAGAGKTSTLSAVSEALPGAMQTSRSGCDVSIVSHHVVTNFDHRSTRHRNAIL